MKIFPAIDLYGGAAVRLYKGDYNNMTVYDKDPCRVAKAFAACGAEYLHMVDLEGAKIGEIRCFDLVKRITSETGLKVEIGGGIRTEEAIDRYLNAGVERVILGTAAVNNRGFLTDMASKYGDRLAVGIDILDGNVAVKGWTERTAVTCDEMFSLITSLGISRVICTDISRDGAMQGTNRALYAELSKTFKVDIVASGGVSSLADIEALRDMNLFGAIIGKAYYTGAIDLTEAIRMCAE
ncbi:MAG: 1-(5-phosphoribosyl)-5-[Clostridia bacterium]|nr:1-(5-phosphoribosyl)-5-[(5-phosphoribosylamino)methylideneamino]imidazole-4-carboxamide isomerase [Clostridia bacterium]